MKKVLIITGVLIAVILISLTVLIKMYVTPDRVKEFVIPTAEESLNRKVDIGDISISLLKGIGLNDFAIKEADQKSDFVRCREFVLKFQLLPLLAKKVIVDELRVVAPEVTVKRDKDGTFNFETIGQKKEAEGVKETEGDEDAEGLPISLLVDKVAVTEAKFSLTDLMNELPDIRSTTDINISLKSLDGSDLFTEGSIDIKADELIMKKPRKRSVKDITLALKYGLAVNLESMDIRIDRGDLNVQGIPVSVRGDVTNVKTSPEVNLSLTVPKAKTDEIQKLAALFTDLKGLSVTGELAADVELLGELKKLDTLKAKGSILLEQVGISYEQINALLDGNITFDEKVMNINLKSTIDKNALDIKGSVRNYMKNQNIDLNIYSQKLFIDELIPPPPPSPEAEEKPKQEVSALSPGKPSKEAEPLDLKISAKGDVKVDSAVYKNMTMSDFFMQFTFRNNKLEIPKMTAKAGKGVLNLNSVIDLSKPGYAYKLSSNVDSLHAEEMVNAFFPKAKDTVFGNLSLNLNMNGAGTLPEQIKKNLVAAGDFNIEEGKITGAEITESLSRFLSIDELKTILLKEAKGTIDIKNGTAVLNSIFSSDDLAMDPSGNIGLDETLDLAFDLKLSPRLTDKVMSSKISKYIKSEEGWGHVPLIVSGTFADPIYAVDVTKVGKKVIEKKVDKYLDELLDTEDEEKKKQLQPAKDLLKGIFK